MSQLFDTLIKIMDYSSKLHYTGMQYSARQYIVSYMQGLKSKLFDTLLKQVSKEGME